MAEALFAPLGVAGFLDGHWGREMLHLAGDADRFAALVNWDDINHALDTQRLESPRLLMVRGGKPIPDHRYMKRIGEQAWIDPGKVSALLSQGVSLVLSYCDEIFPAVRDHTDAVARQFRAHVNCNLYAGWRTDPGLALHWDKHDVIVLQVAGRKRWTVHRPTRPSPHRDDPVAAPLPEGEPVFDQVLEQGGLLYLPRGWWHCAYPLDEPSLHLTFSVQNPAAFDFLSWFQRRLLAEPVVRQDLPVAGDAAQLGDFVAELKSAIDSHFNEAAMADFIAHWEADRRARPRFRLPNVASLPAGGICASTRIRLAAQRGLAPLADISTGALSVLAGDRDWPCSRAAGEALARLDAVEETSFATLAQGLDDAVTQELARILQGMALAGVVFCDAGELDG
ncbi:hypothetical protein GCM10009127_25920 [Alteraurantiacibacter aestuarii]|uniref:cupin domain-containing protein n=1 Tax=Alteraurantiacibacter aestuarii TaxID=650004 RepID=UPI0031CE3701